MASAVGMALQPDSRCATLRVAVREIVCSRLLATFCRETAALKPLDRTSQLPAARQLAERGSPVCLDLAGCDQKLVAAMVSCSVSGHHRFSHIGLLRTPDGPAAPMDIAELCLLLLDELCSRNAGTESSIRERLASDICGSFDASVAFAEARCQRRSWTELRGAARFIAAEQSLAFGHPFHPAPKGCDEQAGRPLAPYRPETGSAFQLHHWAIAPELLREEEAWSGSMAEQVGLGARLLLTNAEADGWPVLPVHPWQVQRLEQRPSIARLLQRGALRSLGPRGERVFPTSSVRTVYAPEADCFVKLPLDARITNFVRNNPQDHLERSLDAAAALSRLTRDGETNGLIILHELGYRSLRPEALGGDLGATDSLAVLFRQGLRSSSEAPPVVVAALVEPALPTEVDPLARVLLDAASASSESLNAAFVARWVARYSATVLIPLLRLFLRHGVSLEAHVQNSLIVLDSGWPKQLVVRDLEGTALARDFPAARGELQPMAPSTSALWASAAEAWQRFMYYVVVNHMAHVIAALSERTPAEEWQLWHVVRGTLQAERELWQEPSDRFTRDLLTRAQLPAKANWSSCLQSRSEKPLYHPITNPLSPASTW